MKIAVDLRPLQFEYKTGVGVLSEQIVDALIAEKGDGKQFFFFSSGYKKEFVLPSKWQNENVFHIHKNIPNKLISILFGLGFVELDRLIEKKFNQKMDLLISPNFHFLSVSKDTPVLQVVHDLSFAVEPGWFSLKQQVWHLLVRPKALCQRARKCVSVSENTKKSLVDLWGISSQKIEVLNPHTDLLDYKNSASSKSESGDILKENSEKALPNLKNEKYILSLASLEPRKNISALIEAYSKFREYLKSRHKLIIIGAPGWKNTELKELIDKNNIEMLGYVSESQKAELVRGATLLSFVTFYEGYGLPVAEAMDLGTPVICSNTTSLPEVGGGDVIYVNPLDVEDIKRGLLLALDENKPKNTKSKEDLDSLHRLKVQNFRTKLWSIIRKMT